MNQYRDMKWREIMRNLDKIREYSSYLHKNPNIIISNQISFCEKLSVVKMIPVGQVCEDAHANCASFLLIQSKNPNLPESLRQQAIEAYHIIDKRRLQCGENLA